VVVERVLKVTYTESSALWMSLDGYCPFALILAVLLTALSIVAIRFKPISGASGHPFGGEAVDVGAGREQVRPAAFGVEPGPATSWRPERRSEELAS
jgi:hypothetical protein